MCPCPWVRLIYIHSPHIADNASLWGNPGHLKYLATTLREKYGKDELDILVAQSNSGSFTYDGVQTGAERVTQEIETLLEELIKDGAPIDKISIVGYSLGGLVARYAVGLLFSKGWFEKIQPVNFTTFACPHLGVRTPLRGYHSHLWNAFGSRTLSVSGRQLFTIDTFGDTSRPLLALLADPDSIFIQALSLFKNKVLYANIINDRSAPYYTTAITDTDPFTDLDSLNISYLDSYSPNIIDPKVPVSSKTTQDFQPILARLSSSGQAFLSSLPFYTLLTLLIPVATVVWTVNSGIQSVRSNKRIQLHEQGKGLESYRKSFFSSENARSAVGGAFRSANARQGQQYLPQASEESLESDEINVTDKALTKDLGLGLRRTTSRKSDFPILALSDEQFTMIKNLNNVGWRKYLVHIHKVRHTHAAIIVRMDRPRFDEGRVVVKHWLEEEFEI